MEPMESMQRKQTFALDETEANVFAIEGESLGLFNKNSKIRIVAHYLVMHQLFDYFIILTILLSSI